MAEATRRQAVNEAKRLRGRNNAPSKGEAALEMHRLGCTGEMAVAIMLGMEQYLLEEQNAKNGSADLPGNIEIKTRSKHGYDLLIQLNDDPSKLFVLVTCNRNLDKYRAVISGWTYGENVMKRELIREFVRGRPCYAVPQSLLNPIETLEKEIRHPSRPYRTLEASEAWITRDNEEILLNLSGTILEELGFKPGDTLVWRADQKTNSCYLKKQQ